MFDEVFRRPIQLRLFHSHRSAKRESATVPSIPQESEFIVLRCGSGVSVSWNVCVGEARRYFVASTEGFFKRTKLSARNSAWNRSSSETKLPEPS